MNYCDELLRNSRECGDKRLAYELDTGREITFAELSRRVESCAAAMRKLSVGPGCAVAIHLYNSIDAIVVHMAVQWLGAQSCFIDALIQPKALPYYIEITSARLLVTRCDRAELGQDVLNATKVIACDSVGELTSETNERLGHAPFKWPEDAVCYVYFTSGTTNEPKGVMLSSRNHENFTRICDTYWKPVDENSRHVCYVPFSHGFGTVFLVPLAIRTRSELYLLRAFHPVKVLDAIVQHGITHIYGVPSHYQQLLRLPDNAGALRRLRMAFCAAAKLEHSLMLQWEAATGVMLCEGYGLIETCCGITWRVAAPSLGTGHMGPCGDNALIEIAILDESDQPQAAGEIGQIAVRGRSVMKGYLKRPDLTAQVMRGDWFLTGDEGYIDANGELFMTGRIKDVINIAGIKVSPYEVEAVLLKHPGVAEAVVVAAPDPLYGEVVKGYVRPRAASQIDERDLLRFASEHLMSFQVPKRIEFLEVMPVNNMGKLDRKKLRALNPV
jgi:long-chain acyl-CoA synthetase